MRKWIDCKDRLPPDGVYVLCLDDGYNYIQQNMIPAQEDIYAAAYDENQKFFTTNYWEDHDWMSTCKPTHWTYLPEF